MTGPGRLWALPDLPADFWRVEPAPITPRRRFDFAEPWHYDYRGLADSVTAAVRNAAAQEAARRDAEFRILYPTVTPPLIPFDRKATPMGPSSCDNRSCAICAPFRRIEFVPVAPAPEFDKRLTNGAKVRLKHKTRDEVIEFTVAAIIRNGSRIVGVRASSTAPRYNAADGYTLEILAPALPTTAGLYTPKRRNGSHLVYRLKAGGGWLRWDTTRDTMETTTAYTVGREVGPEGLVPLKADRAA